MNGLAMRYYTNPAFKLGAFTHPDDIEANLAVFSEHLKTGEPFQIEKRYLRPDGSSLWCAVNVSFVRDGAGKIVSMITVAEDISARKVAV